MTFNIIGSILPEVTIAVAICIVILVNSLLRNASVTLIHSLVLFFLSFALSQDVSKFLILVDITLFVVKKVSLLMIH